MSDAFLDGLLPSVTAGLAPIISYKEGAVVTFVVQKTKPHGLYID